MRPKRDIDRKPDDAANAPQGTELLDFCRDLLAEVASHSESISGDQVERKLDASVWIEHLDSIERFSFSVAQMRTRGMVQELLRWLSTKPTLSLTEKQELLSIANAVRRLFRRDSDSEVVFLPHVAIAPFFSATEKSDSQWVEEIAAILRTLAGGDVGSGTASTKPDFKNWLKTFWQLWEWAIGANDQQARAVIQQFLWVEGERTFSSEDVTELKKIARRVRKYIPEDWWIPPGRRPAPPGMLLYHAATNYYPFNGPSGPDSAWATAYMLELRAFADRFPSPQTGNSMYSPRLMMMHKDPRIISVDGITFVPVVLAAWVAQASSDRTLRRWIEKAVNFNGKAIKSYVSPETGELYVSETSVEELENRFLKWPSKEPAGLIMIGKTENQQGFLHLPDAAKIVGVSSVTMWNWANGGSNGRPMSPYKHSLDVVKCPISDQLYVREQDVRIVAQHRMSGESKRRPQKTRD